MSPPPPRRSLGGGPRRGVDALLNDNGCMRSSERGRGIDSPNCFRRAANHSGPGTPAIGATLRRAVLVECAGAAHTHEAGPQLALQTRGTRTTRITSQRLADAFTMAVATIRVALTRHVRMSAAADPRGLAQKAAARVTGGDAAIGVGARAAIQRAAEDTVDVRGLPLTARAADGLLHAGGTVVAVTAGRATTEAQPGRTQKRSRPADSSSSCSDHVDASE